SDLLIAEPQTLRHAASQVLQKGIRTLHQAPQECHAFRALQVNQDSALAAVDVGVIAVYLPAIPRPFFPWVIDLDDLGPELGERPRGGRPGRALCRVRNAEAVQGCAEAALGCCSAAEGWLLRGLHSVSIGRAAQVYCCTWLQHPTVLRVVNGHDDAG